MITLTFAMGLALAQNAATNAAADGWTNCLVRQIERTYRQTGTNDAIVTAAMRVCASQELNVRRAVEREFGSYSASEVSAELNKLNRYTRTEMTKAVAKMRGTGSATSRPAAPRTTAARPAVGASGRVTRPLRFFNRCRHPVRYFIYHIHADKKWTTHGWFSAPGNKPVHPLTSRGQPVTHLEGEKLFIYGETTGSGPFISWTGTTPATFGGARYSTMPMTMTVKSGNFDFGVSCAGK